MILSGYCSRLVKVVCLTLPTIPNSSRAVLAWPSPRQARALEKARGPFRASPRPSLLPTHTVFGPKLRNVTYHDINFTKFQLRLKKFPISQNFDPQWNKIDPHLNKFDH